jgi:Na+/proline symporter
VSPLDWALVAAYCVLVLGLGLWAQRKGAGDDTDNYFLSGRNLPWWIAGASMAASAFSVDTPMYVSKLTQKGGVSANWEWWFVGISGILGAVVMARYWRRARITTDLELITLRYAGRPSHVLRGFRAVFFGLVFNPLGMAAVITAMTKVLGVVEPTLVGPGDWPTGDGVYLIGGTVLVAVAYSVMSGFMGVVLTDLAQFAISIGGALVMAGYAVSHEKVGGLSALFEHELVAGKTDFLPSFEEGFQGPVIGFCVFVGMLWWTFVNADGGGKYIQRLASCRDETEAERATWFSTVTFVGLRSWPWILVALAALVIFPGGDPEKAYPRFMMELPSGARGFVFASLIAAFMSTIDTQLNWGASYLVNDLLEPYLLPGRSERYYVWAARACAIPTLLMALLFMWLTSASAAGGAGAKSVLSVTTILRSVIAVSAGLGAIYLLRWFWWRLTAWGEIAGMIASPLVAVFCANSAVFVEELALLLNPAPAALDWAIATVIQLAWKIPFAPKLALVTFCTLSAASLTSLAVPTRDLEHLRAFVKRVHPAGLWGPLRQHAPSEHIGLLLLARFAAGNMILFGITFALGGLLLGKGWLLVAGNLAAIGAGLALDRWARRSMPPQELGRDEAPVTPSKEDGPGAAESAK